MLLAECAFQAIFECRFDRIVGLLTTPDANGGADIIDGYDHAFSFIERETKQSNGQPGTLPDDRSRTQIESAAEMSMIWST